MVAIPTAHNENEASCVLPDLDAQLTAAASGARKIYDAALTATRTQFAPDGKVDAAALEEGQHAAHGLSWLLTYVTAIEQMREYANRLTEQSKFGELETLLVQIGCAEYCAQMRGGIPMSQTEFVRLADLGVDADALDNPAINELVAHGSSPEAKARLVELIREQAGAGTFGDHGLDETYLAIGEEMRRFAETEVAPDAHEWHLANDYIPMAIIEKMSELGVFGLTIPEEFGGLGLGKESMCVVSEELSRGYIGVGSLGTRSEIAAELILCGGTDEQKAHWLPRIASGEILPTAVFTEPNT
ncbi:MAG: acyl-CoA dehydrogenase family protein, partial [Pseudomonadota bacterium]